MTEDYQTNDVISAYIAYFNKDGGKQRPALVIQKNQDKTLEVLTITSQYANKSIEIQKQYYPLTDWQKEGLDVQSYVDIRALSKIYIPFQAQLYKIGELTTKDARGLINFLEKYQRD